MLEVQSDERIYKMINISFSTNIISIFFWASNVTPRESMRLVRHNERVYGVRGFVQGVT